MPEITLRPSQISANGTSNGQILMSNGSITYWANNTGGGAGGYTGSVGFTGSAGAAGTSGYNGSTGFTGSTGFFGSFGYTGSVGFTGSTGVGFTGSVGFVGSSGTGFTGSAGAAGATGFTGSAGTGGSGGASVTVSDTAPISPSAGNLWWNSNNGTAFIYYDDGSSSQWVELSPKTVGYTGSAGAGTSSSVTASEAYVGLFLLGGM